jgi:hypothetical protein
MSLAIGHLPLRLTVAIDALLERVDADAPHGVDEALVLVARVDIGRDQLSITSGISAAEKTGR